MTTNPAMPDNRGHDISSGTSLAFNNADNGEQDFANGILTTNAGNTQDAASDALRPPLASQEQVLNDLVSGGSDDGHAGLQIVHDVAPDASLAFYTAQNGGQDYVNGILITDPVNAQNAASDGLSTTPQSRTWQSSMTPIENPNGAPTAIAT